MPESVVTAKEGPKSAGAPSRATKVGRRRSVGRWPHTTVARGLAGVLGFAVVLEGVTRAGLVDPAYFPYASTVFARFFTLAVDSTFLVQVGWTLLAWAIAMLISIVIAVPLGVAIGLSQAVYKATSVPIEVLRPLPAVAFIPLAILLWGAGTTMKVVLTVLAALWPILFNTIYGTHDVDPVTKETARSFRLPQRAMLGRVILPSAAPFVLTGVRISASIGLIVVVGAELVAGATHGIGQYILRASFTGDMTVVLAGAVMAGVLGLCINSALAALEARAFAWAYAPGED